MDWVKQLLAKHTAEDGKVNSEAFLAAVTAEAPKHSVPKAEFNAKNDALKSAQADLDALQKSSGDADALKKQIAEAQDKAAKAEADFAGLQKSTAIREALTAAGATDVEYAMFKLGDVDDIGKLEHRIKDLQADLPTYFPKPGEGDGEGDESKKPGGYKTLDNKLGDGKQLTEAEAMEATLDAAFGFDAA